MHSTLYQAVKRMRELTVAGVCFTFTYQSYSKQATHTSGVKVVKRALLRLSYRDDQSELSQQLITYQDLDNDEAPRMFHLPLLLSFNEYIIKP